MSVFAAQIYDSANLEWAECESMALLEMCGAAVTRAGLSRAELMSDGSIHLAVRGTAVRFM